MSETWTVKRILDWISGYLSEHGDENPLLSAQWLVAEALGVSRIQLYADFDRPLSIEERAILRDYTRRRGAGEPLQYITGTTDFRFITVRVKPGVLIPRPETEVLVSEAISASKARLSALREAAKAAAAASVEGLEEDSEAAASIDAPDQGEDAPVPVDEPQPFRVVDLCTGTGCIACSIAKEIPEAQVVATDISDDAFELATLNARELGLCDRVSVCKGDLASPVPETWVGTVDLVISNPPYIPTSVLGEMSSEVMDFEPKLALDGGEDGLDLFRRMLPASRRLLAPGGVMAVELHETCLDEAQSLAEQAGFVSCRIAADLANRPRVLVAFAPSE